MTKIWDVRESLYPRNLIFTIGARESLSPRKFVPTKLSTLKVVNGLPVPCAPGNCKTKNTIYLVTCKLCCKCYIGRTVQPIRIRMSGHRGNFYKVLAHEEIDETKDDYSLGLHLVHEHHVVDREDFNKHFRVQILENCSPSALEKKEHLHIHKYKTLYPVGLNKNNPFGLSILSCTACIHSFRF